MRITACSSTLPLMCVTITVFWLRPWKGLHFSRVGPNPRGGTLIFSAYVGSDPASTVHPKKISEISNTLKKYLKFLQPQKISRFCIFTLRKDP